MSGEDKEYKPYTTPYTGSGAVKTEQGWVNSRDLGPPGTASGPGPGHRRDSGPPGPAFHHAEIAPTTVAPPPGHEIQPSTDRRSGRRSMSIGSRNPRTGPIVLPGSNTEIKGTKSPDGLGFDLPKYHENLSSMSNREIALKIGLLHIKKGSIHENMLQAATSRDVLSREPHEQCKLREETAQQLNEIEQAIRAWEEVQATRTQNIPNHGLVDMLMMQQDYCEKEKPKDQQPTGNANDGGSSHPSQSRSQEE